MNAELKIRRVRSKTSKYSLPEIATGSEVLTGKKCPYCGGKPHLVDSEAIYGRYYGDKTFWLCVGCDAWVGTHGYDNKTPLGRLADGELREWKKAAHDVFDQLWKAKQKKGFKRSVARGAAYKWLSKEMGIDPLFTHIGMFNVEQCKRVYDLCKRYVRGR